MFCMNDKWDERFMRLAQHVAEWSKDESNKIGAVVVGDGNKILSTGYNGFPRAVNEDVPERHKRPAKYMYTAHAEENAVANAANEGVALKGATIYISGLPPCSTCARLIIQSGIRRVVVQTLEYPERWKGSIDPALEMLNEVGIEISVA